MKFVNLSDMCPKDVNFIRVLVENKIPIVLHFNETNSEIYIYVSEEVKINIINPILEKKHLLDNIFCNISWSNYSNCKNKFTVIHHFCSEKNNSVYIVSLKFPCLVPLQVFYAKSDSKLYYGFKNMQMNVYMDKEYEEIIQEYLL